MKSSVKASVGLSKAHHIAKPSCGFLFAFCAASVDSCRSSARASVRTHEIASEPSMRALEAQNHGVSVRASVKASVRLLCFCRSSVLVSVKASAKASVKVSEKNTQKHTKTIE